MSNDVQPKSNLKRSDAPSLIESDGHLALGELEVKFATELLEWLCRKRVIGSITQRNALMAIMPAEKRAAIAKTSKLATGGPRR